MKRLFLIMALLIASAGAYAGTYNYNPTEVKSFSISDKSSGKDYQYTIEISQRGKNGSWYNSTSTIYLTPKTHSFVGEFTIEDGTLDAGSYVYYSSAYRNFVETYSGYESNNRTKLTIKDNGDGTYTFGGTVICKNGSNYYRYVFTDYIYDPFEIEPAASDFTLDAVNIAAYDQTSIGMLLLDLNSEDGSFAELGFITDTYDIPAGTYSISNSGAKGTIAASTGMDSIYPIPSYVVTFSSTFDQFNYFLASGSVTVAYENGKMNVSGTVRSAHGSTITLNATGNDPFNHGGPSAKTITLDVSDIQATVESSYFDLDITATDGSGKSCDGFVRINSSSLVGEYDYQDFYTWTKFGGSYLDVYSTKHTASIAASGNDDEYIFNCSIVCEDGNTYVVENARFTYKSPAPSGPYALEPEASTFTFTADSEPYVIDNTKTSGMLILEFYNSNFDVVDIAFAADSKEDILSGSYIIDDSMRKGTICASPGSVDYEFQPSYIGIASGWFDTNPYFLTSGNVIVGFEGGKIYITGKVKSYRGSEITLDIKGKDPIKHLLPSNVLNGYVTGTETTYVLARDINTNPDGTISVEATVSLDKVLFGFKPSVEIDGQTYEMDYDPALGACKFTTSRTYSKGDTVQISFKLLDAKTQAINYVVE